MPRHTLSPLDLRVASGLKVIATGSEALAYTPAQLRDRSYAARVRCVCGHTGWIGHHPLIEAGKGDLQLSVLAGKMRCGECGKAGVVEVVDPWRDALD